MILFCINTTNISFTQNSSKEFWPELDVWYKANRSWRVSDCLPFSKNVVTNYREGSFVIQTDYSWRKTKRIIFMRL